MSSRNSKHAVGIDFGGTSTKLALVGEQGTILARARISTRKLTSRADWFDAVESGVEQLRVKGKKDLFGTGFCGMGVGVPGFVDFKRGYVHDLPNVPGWAGVHLAKDLEERFNVRAYIDNDVNAMALGECTFGTGRLYEHAVFITMGTGVGGGLLIHNQLYRGAHSMAGEIGHMPVKMDGGRSPLGRGALEQYVGNQRIVERAVRAIKKGRVSSILKKAGGDLDAITPKEIAQAATEGDQLGIEIFDFVGDCLATALTGVVYLLQPQVIVIGGGVAQSGEVLFGPLERHLRDRLKPVFAERVAVLPARLGNDAGVIGSATLALLS
jgi:glucokinase